MVERAEYGGGSIRLVSVHGGHSGSFCGHALDTLEDIVERYIELGFEWVCLTEHMPAEIARLIAPEDAAQGLSVVELQHRFDQYFSECRRLKSLHRDKIDILVGFETDAYTGYENAVANLISRHQPDMIVGSVHHVHDILFDGSLDDYQRAVKLSGSIEALYCDYFDKQLELIERFEPAVVGHFDLIRIYDADYMHRWEDVRVRDRAIRNLSRIKELGLILDLNVRALSKGAMEPSISAPLMEYAITEGILMSTGDDSHGVESVAANLHEGAHILKARGGSMDWSKPAIGRHAVGSVSR
ncbi:MAG: histidinol-phosphatase [Gammaproteobacteria bacterium]|nr:histidinol-phosphatase [Gammaproteobacteria bacterium]